MINIYLFNFSKKDNSTAYPATDTGSRFRCAVKTGSSIISPVVELSTEVLPAYNYAYIPNFKRWYYITNITYERGVWILSLACDVLASYKKEIGNINTFITRSSYAFDTDLVDRMYPARAEYVISNVTLNADEVVTWATGTFAVNVVNAQSTSGYITYLFSASNFSTFLGRLSTDLTDSSVSVWDSVTESIKITSYDPMRYIGAVMWFPGSVPAGITKTSLKLGNYEVTGISCVQPSFPTTSRTYVVDLPKHPQASARGRFTNLAPYSEYTLELGPFGDIKLDTTALYDQSKLFVVIDADWVTGNGRAFIYAGSQAITPISEQTLLANTVCQYGVPIRISSLNSLTAGSLLTTVGGVAGIIGGIALGDAGAAVAGFNSAVSGVESMAKGSFDSVGNTGSIADHMMKKILYCRFWYITNEDRQNNGRPLCQMKTISAIPGFIQAQKGTFASTQATRPELDAVNAYMEGGFYFE